MLRAAFKAAPLSLLPLLHTLGDHEVFGRAPVGLGDEFERLDE
jgi:hypothetical protein